MRAELDISCFSYASNVLNDNLSRIMSFFEIEKISKAITVCIHTEIEEWKNFITNMGTSYQDYVVGCVWEGKIDFQQFLNLHSPYCAAQKLVKGLVEKVSHKELLEYACDAEKLYMDWEKIWES